MALTHLFPRPKQVVERGQGPQMAGRQIQFDIPSDASVLLQRGSELLERGIAGPVSSRTNGGPYVITLQVGAEDPAWPDDARRDEAYTLELGEDGGRLHAATEGGIFLGFQTLRQLLSQDLGTLPSLRIVDWPDLRYRGLYLESKWGPDLMSLDDWKGLIDYLASLKFNSLCVGVYGCWIVQYGGKVTEFLMLPFPEHPQLATPKTIRYFSPEAGAWQTLDYLPRMVTEDFFGELVAYAKEQNITVRPHFNSPGHNTLIPRVYPEISAKDEAGNPIGYGFCLSNPRTYELLLELYDRVIDQYLLPHGVDWFHIGLDEVEAYAGIDESDPARLVEPWCRCPDCQDKPRGRQLQEYAIRVCRHLKERGITNITMWNDALEKLDALDEEFGQMLAEAGLSGNVVVQWWRYNEPVLAPRPEIGVRAWSTPMAGYWSNLFTQSYTSNIYAMLLHGYRAGAEGGDAYCIYDPAFDYNYACLAEFSWNQTPAEDLYQFKSRYARATLQSPLDPCLAAEAFDKYEQAFGSMPWTGSVLDSLLYYWHTYPLARKRELYPRDILIDLQHDRLRLRQAMNSAATHARTARDLFYQANQSAKNSLLEQYRVECEKLVGMWEAFSSALTAVDRYTTASGKIPRGEDAATTVAEAASLVMAGRDRIIAVMADLERVKKSFLLPQILRDLSIALLYFERLGEEFQDVGRQLSAGVLDAPPPFLDLQTNLVDLDPFVSTAVQSA